jgi:hypothetical protein
MHLPADVAAELLRQLNAELSRRSLAEFVRGGWHVLEPTARLIWGPHLDLVCTSATRATSNGSAIS